MRGETQDQALLLQTVASSHNYEQKKHQLQRGPTHFWEIWGSVIAIVVMPLFGVLTDVYRGMLWDPEKIKPHITTILRAASVGAW